MFADDAFDGEPAYHSARHVHPLLFVVVVHVVDAAHEADVAGFGRHDVFPRGRLRGHERGVRHPEAKRRVPGPSRRVRDGVERHDPSRFHQVERDGVQRALQRRVAEQHQAVVGDPGHGAQASLDGLHRAPSTGGLRSEAVDAVARRLLVQAVGRWATAAEPVGGGDHDRGGDIGRSAATRRGGAGDAPAEPTRARRGRQARARSPRGGERRARHVRSPPRQASRLRARRQCGETSEISTANWHSVTRLERATCDATCIRGRRCRLPKS